jgi:ABC-2 type transport system permease protein
MNPNLALLIARQHRWTLTALVVGTGIVTAAAVPAYGHTYADAAAEYAAARLARANGALTLLYGRLPEPGTPAQFAVWEFGALSCLILAVLFALLTVQCTRAAEDTGQTEIIRSCGVRPATALRAALGVLTATAVATGAAAGAGLTALRSVGVVTAFGYGGAVTATLLVTVCVVAALAQIAPDAAHARVLASGFVASAFIARAIADGGGPAWAAWWSPLAIRTAMAPATTGRWWPAGVAVLAAAVSAAFASVLAAHRDLGAGHWPRLRLRVVSLRVRSPFGLALRLSRATLVTWTIAIAADGAVLTAMGQSTVRSARAGQLHGGVLGAQMTGTDPATAFIGYVGVVLAVAAAVHAVSAVTRVRADERGGQLELIRATGVPPWQPLAAGLGIAWTGSLIILATAAAACGIVGHTMLGVADGEIARRILGQWAATAVSAGLAALIVGAAPRWTGLAWLPLAAGGATALLGTLLGLPTTIIDHGPFAQPGHPWGLVLTGIGGTAGILGCAFIRRRDLLT